MQFDDTVFPDAPDIALVAHGNVAVIAAQEHLSTLCDDVAGAVDPGIREHRVIKLHGKKS